MANEPDTSELGQAIQEVTEKLSLLFREEIELAKAEMTEKVTKLLRGAVIGIVAGLFVVFGLIYFFEGIAWAIWKGLEGGGNDDFWIGFVILAVILFIVAALAGFIASRLIKRGSPPTPKLAIEEAQLIKETVTTSHPATPQGPS